MVKQTLKHQSLGKPGPTLSTVLAEGIEDCGTQMVTKAATNNKQSPVWFLESDPCISPSSKGLQWKNDPNLQMGKLFTLVSTILPIVSSIQKNDHKT